MAAGINFSFNPNLYVECIVIRHGATKKSEDPSNVGNPLGYMIEGGSRDEEINGLSKAGCAQAAAIGDWLKKNYPDLSSDEVYSSRLSRCVQTTETALKAYEPPLELQRDHIIDDLREIEHGEGDGVLRSEVRNRDFKEKFKEYLATYQREHPNEAPPINYKWTFNPIPKAETAQQAYQRFVDAIVEIAKAHLSKQPATPETKPRIITLIFISSNAVTRLAIIASRGIVGTDGLFPQFFESEAFGNKILANGTKTLFHCHPFEEERSKQLQFIDFLDQPQTGKTH